MRILTMLFALQENSHHMIPFRIELLKNLSQRTTPLRFQLLAYAGPGNHAAESCRSIKFTLTGAMIRVAAFCFT